MLVEFRVTNFRSIRSQQTLSMVASSFPEHQDTNTFNPELPGFGRFLRSSVVYGANAAGKTNLLRALQFVQALVVNSALAPPVGPLPYDPFKFSKLTREAPSEFEVTFVQNKIRYEYGFSLNRQRICQEWLVEYVHPRGRTLFEREYVSSKEKYEWKFGSFLRGQRAVWSEATRPNALFLSTAIQLNSKQLLPAFEWFQKRLHVIVGATSLNPALTLQLLDQPEGKERLLPFIREADFGISDVTVEREPLSPVAGIMMFPGIPIIEHRPGSPTPDRVRITFSHRADGDELVGLDFSDESAGTQLLFRAAGAWLNIFSNGEILLFDEIDTSLHQKLVQFLINQFHSDKTNLNNSQLIFSTHNTSFLDLDLFRRDQIWFVDKDRDASSKLYPLSDFRPRNDEVIGRWYMRGRYGALPVLNELR